MWRTFVRTTKGKVIVVCSSITAAAAIYGFANIGSGRSAVRFRNETGMSLQRLPICGREEQWKKLCTNDYDVLIIGGGATGSGVALDAVTRGLSTAMVEKDDFSSGTSSRSTKLIHGGVRYLQKAVFGLDYNQYSMVKEALHERANLLDIAPHLSAPLPILLPCYKWWEVPYYYFGIKAYDFVSGRQILRKSYILSKKKTLDQFPMLKKDKLVCGIVYYDGQHNDSRMNVSIALTSASYGATILNHCEVTKLLKDSTSGKINGAICKDRLTGREIKVMAKCVVNATGPFTDGIRAMDRPDVTPICQPSSGVHIVLPDYYSPATMGLLDPSTSDGRVIFFLPWLNHTIAGTTDAPCPVTESPTPSEKEIRFILDEIRNYLTKDVQVRRGDVKAAWSGIRPLVRDPNKPDTQSLARNHIIEISPSNLVTIAGGKWTTYRAMAAETIDAAIKACELHPTHNSSQTVGLLLEGAHGWSPIMHIQLSQDYGLESDVSKHLSSEYGDKAFEVAKLAQTTGLRWPLFGQRLVEGFPYIEAEVRYCCRMELAATAIDVLARRMRLAFLNTSSAEAALPRVVDVMAEELKWSSARKKAELESCRKFIYEQMGAKAHADHLSARPINMTANEVTKVENLFKQISSNHVYITIQDLRNYFKKQGKEVSDPLLHQVLRDIDSNLNGQVDKEEFLQMLSAVKSGDHLGNILTSTILGSSTKH